jgi:hypothetical protein
MAALIILLDPSLLRSNWKKSRRLAESSAEYGWPAPAALGYSQSMSMPKPKEIWSPVDQAGERDERVPSRLYVFTANRSVLTKVDQLLEELITVE